MKHTIDRLLKGDSEIHKSYLAADKIWSEFFSINKNSDIGDWARDLPQVQRNIERAAGQRGVGKEITGWSGFGHLYSIEDGLEETRLLAEKLSEAFDESSVSIEAKVAARAAAKFYLG